MKALKSLITVSLIAILGSGCLQPLKNWLKITKQEVKTEQKIDKNKDETVEKAKGTVWATDYSLSKDPAPNIFSTTAKDLNLRTQAIVGTPSLDVIKEYQKIIDGLVSTNELLRVDAQKALGKKDNEIVGLQSNLKELQTKLGKIEEEKNKLGLENSVLGQKWSNIKKWFWVIVYSIIGIFIFRVVLAVVPPPYNQIGHIVDGIFGLFSKFVFRALPKAKEFAGVVGHEVHQLSEQTLKHLVMGLQEIREKEIKPEEVIPQSKNLQIKDLIDNTLSAVTDRSSREKIVEIKKSLNLI